MMRLVAALSAIFVPACAFAAGGLTQRYSGALDDVQAAVANPNATAEATWQGSETSMARVLELQSHAAKETVDGSGCGACLLDERPARKERIEYTVLEGTRNLGVPPPPQDPDRPRGRSERKGESIGRSVGGWIGAIPGIVGAFAAGAAPVILMSSALGASVAALAVLGVAASLAGLAVAAAGGASVIKKGAEIGGNVGGAIGKTVGKVVGWFRRD